MALSVNGPEGWDENGLVVESGGNNICGLNNTEDDDAAHVMEDVTSLVTGDNNPGPPSLIISRFLLTSTIRHLQIHQLQISADIRFTTNHSTLSLIFTGWYWSLFSSERLDMSLRRFVTVLKQILNLLFCLDWIIFLDLWRNWICWKLIAWEDKWT